MGAVGEASAAIATAATTHRKRRDKNNADEKFHHLSLPLAPAWHPWHLAHGRTVSSVFLT